MSASELAREAWKRYETIHGPVYFTPEMVEMGKELGLKGYWMAYFAFRVAPMGALGPAETTALFYNWHPRRVSRALPDAWAHTTPEQVLDARLRAAGATLRRLFDGQVTDAQVETAADLAWDRAQAVDLPGRPLGAVNHALPRPDDAYERLWQATTTLREHRGDGHNAALLTYGVGPAEAHILKGAAGEADAQSLKAGRQWEDDEWDAATASLVTLGWLDGERLTAAGESVRAAVEHATDVASAAPWDHPDAEATIAALEPLAAVVSASGVLPSPSPAGLRAP